MPRPRIYPEERKERVVRFTTKQWVDINKAAEAAGVSSNRFIVEAAHNSALAKLVLLRAKRKSNAS